MANDEAGMMSERCTAGGGCATPATAPADRWLWLTAALLCAAMFIVLAWPAFMGRIYDADDLTTQHLPLRAFYQNCLRNGDSFLWCPNLFCGYYAHGEGQTGMCHPLHWLLYRFLPLGAAFSIELLHTYPLALLGMFLLLRRHGAPAFAALYGGFAFAFSGYMMWHYVHMHVIAIMAHAPWLLLCVNLAMRSTGGGRAAGLCGLGLLTASQLLLGHPQHVWFSSLAELAYALWLARADRSAARLPTLALFKALGVLAAAVQWLPSRDALVESVRAAPTLAYRCMGSLDPVNLAQIVAPWAFRSGPFNPEAAASPNEFALYAGALTPVLLAWLLWRRRDLGALRSLAVGAAVIAAFALVMALGKYGGLYFVQAYLPVVGLFRMPSRYIVLFHLACAALAALALWDLTRATKEKEPAPRRPWPLFIPLALSVAVALAFLLCRKFGPASSAVVQQMSGPMLLLAGPLLIGAATAFLLLTMRGKRWALIALIAFGAADLAVYGMAFVWRTKPQPVARVIGVIPPPPFAADSRAYTEQSLANRLIVRGVRLADGYVGLYPRKELDYHSVPALQVAQVGWLVREVNGRPRWVTAPREPLPRARLLSRAVATADPRRDIESIDPGHIALVENALDLSAGPIGRVAMLSDRPGRIRMTTDAGSRQLLVLSESWSAGWRATVDGTPADVVRVYGDFMGCVVPEGAHEVEFIFDPASFAVGRAVSLAALALLAAVTAFVALRDRPRRDALPVS